MTLSNLFNSSQRQNLDFKSGLSGPLPVFFPHHSDFQVSRGRDGGRGTLAVQEPERLGFVATLKPGCPDRRQLLGDMADISQ